jgi:hypothetical protein
MSNSNSLLFEIRGGVCVNVFKTNAKGQKMGAFESK